MTVKDLKTLGEIFNEIKERRDKELKYRCQKELQTCFSIEQEIQKENDILISKARESAFQEMLNIIMERKANNETNTQN